MWDDTKEYIFSPLSIPKSDLTVDLGGTYRIYRKNGEMVEVKALSAAEAVEKSGVNDAIKIVSMAVLRKQMMDKNILSPIDEMIETDIDVDKNSPTGLGFLFVTDEKQLQTANKPEFELFGLGDLASLSEQSSDILSPNKNESQQNEEPENKAVETAKNNIETPEAKELSSEEVSNLLSKNDS